MKYEVAFWALAGAAAGFIAVGLLEAAVVACFAALAVDHFATRGAR